MCLKVPDMVSGRSASFAQMYRYASRRDLCVLAGGVGLCALSGFLSPLNSLIFKGITDTLIRAETELRTNASINYQILFDDCLHYVLLYALLGVALFILGTVSMGCLFTVCENQVHEIRKRYFAAVMRQDMAWFDRHESGVLTTKLHDSIDRMKDGMGDKVGIVVRGFAQMIGGIILGFCLSWELTLIMLIIAPLMVASLVGSAKEMSAYEKAGAVAEEVLAGVRTVTAFNAQYFEVTRYESCLKLARRLGIRKVIITGTFASVFNLLMFCSMSIGFWIGTQMMLNGQLSSGTIFGVFWAVLVGAMSLGSAAPQIGVILAAKIAAGGIFDIIDREPEIDCMNQRGKSLTHMEGRIEFTNINFRYPTRPTMQILNGVSFVVNPGQTIALVGASGCGKSTIFGLLLRYYDQDSGTLTIDGIPVRDLNVQWLRSVVSIVQQEPSLFATTIERNLKLGKDDLSQEEMIHVCKMANAHDFIMQLPHGYKSLIGEGGVQLSGGQKQRIAIARALTCKPRILLLDEATSALDAESEQIVQDALDKTKAGRTTLIIAHRLSTVQNADRIIVFDAGRIAESGSHEELIAKSGIYARLVKAQEIAEKAKDDTITEDDLEATLDVAMMERGTKKKSSKSVIADEQRASVQRARTSSRLRQSISSVASMTETERETVQKREELADEGAREASLMQIARFADQELPIAAIGLGFAVLRGLSWPIFAIIYGRTFLVLSSNDREAIASGATWNAVSYFFLGIVSGAATLLSGGLFGVAGERMTLRLRLAVFQNILRQDGEFFDNRLHSPGKLSARLASDAPNVKAAIDQRLAETLQGIASLISGVVVAFYFGWNVAPIGVVTAVLLIAAQSAVAKYLKQRGIEDADCADEASRIASESIDHVRTIQALTRQRLMYTSFTLAMREPHRRALIRGAWQALSLGMANSFMMFNFATAYGFGLWLIMEGWTTPFVVFQVIEALNMASITFLSVASYFPEYVRARVSAGLMFTMMDRTPKIDNLSESGNRDPVHGDVVFRDITFAYPTRISQPVLNRFNISVSFGRTVALVGPSGCGKSTVVQLLERFYDVNSGVVMALVGQEPVLFNLSIRQNITYGLELATQAQIEDAAKLANIHSFIISLPEGYETLVGGHAQLSGGQKQRIAIARAIIRNPKILLLDEATSALDTESEKIVQEALDRARTGRTCITIAHRLSTVQNADLIVVIRKGKVLEFGNHVQLLARKGLYYRMIEKQKIN